MYDYHIAVRLTKNTNEETKQNMMIGVLATCLFLQEYAYRSTYCTLAHY